MTDVRPFRALRYDPDRIDLSRVVVPPYDVISPAERRAYWEGDPHCAIRLILTRDAEREADADYHDVAETLARWQDEGASPLHTEWRGLAHGVGETTKQNGQNGKFLGTDERFGMLLRSAETTHLIPLSTLLET